MVCGQGKKPDTPSPPLQSDSITCNLRASPPACLAGWETHQSAAPRVSALWGCVGHGPVGDFGAGGWPLTLHWEQGPSSDAPYEPWVYKTLVWDTLLKDIRCLRATCPHGWMPTTGWVSMVYVRHSTVSCQGVGSMCVYLGVGEAVLFVVTGDWHSVSRDP